MTMAASVDGVDGPPLPPPDVAPNGDKNQCFGGIYIYRTWNFVF